MDIGVLREDLVRIKDQKSEVRSPKSEVKDTPIVTDKTRLDLLVEQFLALLLRFPQLLITDYSLLITTLSPSPYASLYEILKKQYTLANSIDLQNVRIFFAREGEENIVDVLLMKGEKDFSDLSEADAQKECAHLIQETKGEWIKKERARLLHEITEAERNGEAERLSSLIAEFQKLSI